MNIEVQCCGMAILLMIWYFSLRQKPLGLESEKLFLITLAVNSFCLVMDILSIAAIIHREVIPELLLALICKTYIVSLVWVGYFGLIYSSTDFKGTRAQRRRKNRAYTFIVIAGTLLIYLLPIHYYLEGNIVYTYGPSCMATYLFALLFVLVTLYKAGIRGRDMNPKRRRAITIWMLIWIMAAVTQFFNANLLLVGFASVLGMVILFFELENPEANLDRETGAYNAHALGEYTKQLYEKEEKFCALLVACGSRAVGDEESPRQTDKVLLDIVLHADQIKDVKVFKTLERELVFLTSSQERMWETYRNVKDYIDSCWRQKVSPCFVVLPNSLALGSVEELFQMLRLFRVDKRKNQTDNSIVLDENRIHKYKEREKTEAMIRSAIEEDRIEVYFQPIYSTRQHRFVSAEALTRIRRQDGTIVTPGAFVPIAEKNGLISRIGENVFDQVCAFIQKNQLWQQGIGYVEVNLSVRQCEDPKLAETYIRIMERYGLDPSCVILEITESASIRLRDILLENMRVLMDYGVKFALDDFGNGESNLNYIVDMPVSIVKFDRDMTQAYFSSYKAKFVMEAAMHMIHDMKLEVVSEGVETEEQAQAIEALGIEYIQGYYFSRPLPGAEFLKFVAGSGQQAIYDGK